MGNCMRKRKDVQSKNLTPSNSLSLKYELGNTLRKTLKKPIVEKKYHVCTNPFCLYKQ